MVLGLKIVCCLTRILYFVGEVSKFVLLHHVKALRLADPMIISTAEFLPSSSLFIIIQAESLSSYDNPDRLNPTQSL